MNQVLKNTDSVLFEGLCFSNVKHPSCAVAALFVAVQAELYAEVGRRSFSEK